MPRRARLRVLLLSLLAPLVVGLVAPAPVSAQETASPTGTLSGMIDASDGRAVNALIGFDFLDAQGRRLRRDGCVQSPECPLVGYASALRVNAGLGADGSTDRAAWRTDWSVQVPTATAQIFFEAYPQNAAFRTDESRYGHAMRHSVKLPVAGPVVLQLPLVLCGEGGTVGSLSGTGVRDGAPLPLKRVVAWGLDPYDPVRRPIVGWNIGTARADGTFVVPNLPPDQRYQLWLTAADGTVRKTFGVVPKPCADTSLQVSFDAPSPAPVPPSPPTIAAGSAVTTAGSSVTLTGAAVPGDVVQLWGYSRPSTTYRLLRSTIAAPTGLYTFTVTPPTDTRLRVRAAPARGGLDSASVVVGVGPQVRTGIQRLARRTYRFSGTVFPKRAGMRVEVLARTSTGLRSLTHTVTRADGRWAVDRRFTGTATWDVVARTGADTRNRSGTSAPVRLAIR